MACEPVTVLFTPPDRPSDKDVTLRCQEHGDLKTIRGVNYDLPKNPWDCNHPVTESVFREVWRQHLATVHRVEPEEFLVHLL